MDPANGAVEVSGSTPGSTAVYTCNEGFHLVGRQTIVCSLDWLWGAEPPICIREALTHILLYSHNALEQVTFERYRKKFKLKQLHVELPQDLSPSVIIDTNH